MKSTAFRSTARSTTIRRTPHRRLDNKKSKSTPARLRRTPKAKASPASSTRSSRPVPIRATQISDLGIGSPVFYHKANIEAGGASPDRLFSYYVGFGGYNQDFRVLDQQDGAAYGSTLGYLTGAQCPAGTAGPASCYSNGVYQGGNTASPFYVLGGYNFYDTNMITDRDNVVNFHFAIPHHHDGGRDDIQLLWQSENLTTYAASEPGDLGVSGPYAAFPYANVYSGPPESALPGHGYRDSDELLWGQSLLFPASGTGIGMRWRGSYEPRG